MVVSGLPQPNEGRHIAEICSMALNLLDEVSHFTVRHRTDETIKLRIGIHTGSCAAGAYGPCMFQSVFEKMAACAFTLLF